MYIIARYAWYPQLKRPMSMALASLIKITVLQNNQNTYNEDTNKYINLWLHTKKLYLL